MSNNEGRCRGPSQLIQELVGKMSCWDLYEDDYLNEIIPMFVKNPRLATTEEQAILRELKSQLTESEWEALPQLVAEFRNGSLRELEGERLMQAVQNKEKQKAEQKRIQQERIIKKAETKKQKLLKNIDLELQRDFLGADKFFKSQMPGIVSENEFKTKKINFVRAWFIKRNESMGADARLVPDDEQLEAITTVNGHVHVVARAGSGKTATLVYRALFLIEHCRVFPSSMLILAFNRKAAIEIRSRLLGLMHHDAENQIRCEVNKRRTKCINERHLVKDSDLVAASVSAVSARLQVALPHIMTFHALAHALVHPEDGILYDDARGGAQELSRVVQSIIDDHIQSPEYHMKFRELMIAYFKEDWDRIVAGGYNLSKKEFLQLRRSLTSETLKGDYVKSYGEKLIANFLFEHDIKYNYEQNWGWNNTNYQPDFTVFNTDTAKSGIIIEYFGLRGDPDYDDMSEQKRQFWANKSDWELIEFSPSDIRQGETKFYELLKNRLGKKGIPCIRLSEEEIWHRISYRAIDSFAITMKGFVQRCRKLSLTPQELQNMIDNLEVLSPAEAMFLPFAYKIYSAYLVRISATGEDDFDGMMQRAATAVSNGFTRFDQKQDSGDIASLKHIFIDEFQDFSELIYRFLSSIRKQNPNIQLFCVGDDWQAINGFAGSDLRFFLQFEKFIGESIRLYISTNYRSKKSIVNIGNALMKGLGKPAVANNSASGMVVLADASMFIPTPIEKDKYLGDIITPMVSRILNKSLAMGSSVVLLGRMNSLPWYVKPTDQVREECNKLDNFLKLLRLMFPKEVREYITISTAHSYKGLEKPTVIILDAIAGRYPLIHPTWIFSRVLGESLEKIIQEERRLFYVALTRAIDKLVIITDGQRPSPFLEEIQRVMPLSKIKWDDYPVVFEQSSQLIIKVGNQSNRGSPTFAIREQLKACGYRWQNTGWNSWVKVCLVEGFQMANIKEEIWTEAANGIEVRICDESDQVLRVYNINNGNWEQVFK